MLQSVPIPGPHGVRPSLLVHSLLMLRTLERREATYEISVVDKNAGSPAVIAPAPTR